MFKRKTKKGITLISLVITVIILLILAAVAINLAIDSNGLFKKTGDAANTWNAKVAEEQSTLQDLFEQAGIETPTEITTDLPEGWSSEVVSEVAKQGNRTAPIPKEFVASSVKGEDSISGGLVIYETTTPVTDANHDTALTEYNQYVWIPVDDINDMVMCSVCGGASRNIVYSEKTKTLTCTNTHAEGTEPKLVGKLYEGTYSDTTEGSNKIHSYTMDFTKNDQTYDPNSGYREPAIVIDEDKDDATSGKNYMELAGIADKTVASFLSQLENDFENMAKSVAKYKGFYISRYEIGANCASKKEQTVLNAGSANRWYGLYNTIRKTGSSTESQMVWRKPV